MQQEVMKVTETWNITYEHSLGECGTRFFAHLKDTGRLLGRRCPTCGRVLLPPRSFCDRCYVKTAEWVEVGTTGTIEAFTIVKQAFKGLPEPPYALAYVLLEGADTAILNYVRGIPLDDVQEAARRLAIGTRVVVKTKPDGERRGDVSDFWFEVAE